MKNAYFVMVKEKPDGPFTLGQLRHFMDAGALKPEALCAREGDSNWRPVQSIVPPRKKTPGLLIAGILLCGVGAMAALYFLFAFNVSVSTDAGQVANLDLLSQRQNGVIISAALILSGVGCLIGNAIQRTKPNR